MTRSVPFAVVVLVCMCCAPVFAGEYNKKVSIGDAAPSFNSLPAVDGKNYSLSDFANKDVLVLVVTCNHCPVATAYEDRIIDIAKKYASGPDSKVALVAINVNNLEQDKLPKMKERAEEKGFNFPYLYDASQAIGRALGATVTPEFFVYDKQRKLVYTGAMDNSQRNPTTDYLTPAVEAALHGTSAPTAETPAHGCSVKYEK
jgi:peroxiredoxin